jgi:GGDEF domain-containing protein
MRHAPRFRHDGTILVQKKVTLMLRACKKSAVVELTIKQARYVYDMLGDSVGSSLMAELTDRLSTTVMRRGIMWRTGDDRLSLSLMHAREIDEIMPLAGYLIRMIEAEPFEVDAYRLYMSAEAHIRLCMSDSCSGCCNTVHDAAHDRITDAVALPSSMHGSLTLASVNRIPVHVGRTPARISKWGSELVRLQTSLRLPRHGQLAVEVMTRVQEQEVRLSGRVIWAGVASGNEFEYGIQLESKEPAYAGGFDRQ